MHSDSIVNLSMQTVRESRFEFLPENASASILARRKDLAGAGPQFLLPLENGRALLSPGRWELKMLPPDGQYVSTFSGPHGQAMAKTRPDGWNEVTVFGSAILRFTTSGGGGAVHGTVKSGGTLVPGAPVFLEAYDADTRQRLLDLRETRADTQGAYRFGSVAPGTYRILATFEYPAPDSGVMDVANARAIPFEPQSNLQLDLDLYILR